MDSSMEPTVTRSKVLKRAAVGAAAVWSVPLFASAASAKTGRTDAGSVAKCSQPDPAGNPWRVPLCNFQECGPAPNGTHCFCYAGAKSTTKSSGCCKCNGNILCSNSPACPLGPSQCPAGWACTFNNCFNVNGGQPSCVPPCGSGIAGVVGGAGAATAAG